MKLPLNLKGQIWRRCVFWNESVAITCGSRLASRWAKNWHCTMLCAKALPTFLILGAQFAGFAHLSSTFLLQLWYPWWMQLILLI